MDHFIELTRTEDKRSRQVFSSSRRIRVRIKSTWLRRKGKGKSNDRKGLGMSKDGEGKGKRRDGKGNEWSGCSVN